MLWREQRKNGLEAAVCYHHVHRHHAVTQLDSITEQTAEEVHRHQSLLRRVLGVEQVHVNFIVAELEIILKHTIVEQHLNVVLLQLHSVFFFLARLDVPVLSRFLLHQHPLVHAHKVHTTHYSELLANERGLEQRLICIERSHAIILEHIDCSTDIFRLSPRIVNKRTGREWFAGAEAHRLVAEVMANSVVCGGLWCVDGVIEHRTCKVSE